jgi:CHASE3 domain sensor protein
MVYRIQFPRVLAFLLLASFPMAAVAADSHVVTPGELQNELVAASRAQQRNLETVQQFVSSQKAQKAINSVGLDPQQIRTAVSQLNAEELAELAQRAEKAQADFAAGALSDRELIYIIVGVAILILIIVAI